MAELYMAKLRGGSTLYIEGETSKAHSGVSLGREIEAYPLDLDKALFDLSRAVDTIRRNLFEASLPDELELRFGVKLSERGGAIITNSVSESNFEITFRWKKPPSE